jgi:hypothetical protein
MIVSFMPEKKDCNIGLEPSMIRFIEGLLEAKKIDELPHRLPYQVETYVEMSQYGIEEGIFGIALDLPHSLERERAGLAQALKRRGGGMRA